jgi:hypothetical protein
VLGDLKRGSYLDPGCWMAGDRGPDPDGAVARFPQRPVYGATGPGRRIVGLGEVGEDEVFEPMRGQRHGGGCRLGVREVAVPGADPALQARRVWASTEPVWIVVRFEDHRFGSTHAPQYIDSSLPEVRRHRYGITVVGHPNSVSLGVVRDFEESYTEVFDGAGLFRGYRVRAEGLADAWCGVDLDFAFAHQRGDAAGVVGVSVGQQDGVYSGNVSADLGEEGGYAPWREAGVDEDASRVRFYVGCIARATARKNTQPQIRPLSGWAFDQRERNPRLDLSTPIQVLSSTSSPWSIRRFS